MAIVIQLYVKIILNHKVIIYFENSRNSTYCW